MLEFIVPILYPEKPGRVTKEIGNTIFGALAGEYKVNWGQMIQRGLRTLGEQFRKGESFPY